MKRFYLFLGLVAIGFAATAQFQNINSQLSIPDPMANMASRMWGTNADSSTTYDWNITKWDAKLRKVYTYDALNRVSTMMEYDANTGALEHKYTYTYNSKDQEIEILMEANFGGNLQPFNRFRTNYDGRGHRTSYKKESFVNSQWVVDEGDSMVYIYDGQDHVTELFINQLSGANVIPVQKLVWSDFGTDDYPQTLVVQSYSGGFNNYVKLENISWKGGFDLIDFNPSAYLGSLWQNNDWMVISYDTSEVKDGKIQTSYLFNVNGSQLDSSSRTEFLYDKTGRQMQALTYLYQSNTWTAYTGDRDSIAYGSYDEIQKRTISYYSQADKAWIPGAEERFYYNALSVERNPIEVLKLYPNPAHDFVQFSVPETDYTVEVFDLQGKSRMKQENMSYIKTGLLEEGIYILHIQSGMKTYTARLSVVH